MYSENVTKIWQHGYAMCKVSVTWTAMNYSERFIQGKHHHCTTSTVFMDIVNCLTLFFRNVKDPFALDDNDEFVVNFFRSSYVNSNIGNHATHFW